MSSNVSELRERKGLDTFGETVQSICGNCGQSLLFFRPLNFSVDFRRKMDVIGGRVCTELCYIKPVAVLSSCLP